jgi:hypothetical protein
MKYHLIRIGDERGRLVAASPVMTKSWGPSWGSNYPENGLEKPPRRDTRALSSAGMFGGKVTLRLAALKSRPHAPLAPTRFAPSYFICKRGVAIGLDYEVSFPSCPYAQHPWLSHAPTHGPCRRVCETAELELELIQTQMAHKPILRAEEECVCSANGACENQGAWVAKSLTILGVLAVPTHI